MSYYSSNTVLVLYQQMDLYQLSLLRLVEMDDFVVCIVVAEGTASMCEVIAVVTVAVAIDFALDYSHQIKYY